MTRKQKYQGTIMARTLVRVAAKIGATVHLEPTWKIAGQIVYKSGRTRYFRFSSIDLNPLGATEIAKDKDYANYFLKRLGYPTIPGDIFFSSEWNKALRGNGTLRSDKSVREAAAYAQRLGYPLIVKPNSQSQGRAVTKVYNARDLSLALARVFKIDRVALVQRVVTGRDYRIVVLDDVVISAYERIPLSIVGDGTSTVAELLRKKQRAFEVSGRDTVLKVDDRVRAKLATQGFTLRSRLTKGEKIFLLDNANLSQGGDSLDVTHVLHKSIADMAMRMTRDMGLRLCGVDVMIDGDITEPLALARTWHVIEINAAPGLDHYATGGRAQEKIVEDLYLQVLQRMEFAH